MINFILDLDPLSKMVPARLETTHVSIDMRHKCARVCDEQSLSSLF